jgi:glycosyltransferase involved in cell wall biosynthesis
MDVAVIIPTTGQRPRMLERALLSALSQRRAPTRVVIVVDGPAAAAAPVAALVEGVFARTAAPISVISTGERRGVSWARNLGARTVESEHVAFLDDDDEWTAEHLWSCSTEADLNLSAFMKQGRGGRAPEKTPPGVLHPRAFFVTNPGFRGSNIVVRREVFFKVGGFDETLPALNDLDLGARLSEVPGLRYQRTRARTVVFHRHDRGRLTDEGSSALQVGVHRFWERWRGRMTGTERARFVERCRLIHAVDLEVGS